MHKTCTEHNYSISGIILKIKKINYKNKRVQMKHNESATIFLFQEL